nr:hypothetical protein [uncultured Nitrososphaera sp.]
MKISLEGLAVAGVVGGLDIGVEMLDKGGNKQPGGASYKPFMNATDIARVGFLFGSFFAAYMVKSDKVEEKWVTPIFYAAVPLFSKTLKNALTTWTGGVTAGTRSFRPASTGRITSGGTGSQIQVRSSQGTVSMSAVDSSLSTQMAESGITG